MSASGARQGQQLIAQAPAFSEAHPVVLAFAVARGNVDQTQRTALPGALIASRRVESTASSSNGRGPACTAMVSA